MNEIIKRVKDGNEKTLRQRKKGRRFERGEE